MYLPVWSILKYLGPIKNWIYCNHTRPIYTSSTLYSPDIGKRADLGIFKVSVTIHNIMGKRILMILVRQNYCNLVFWIKTFFLLPKIMGIHGYCGDPEDIFNSMDYNSEFLQALFVWKPISIIIQLQKLML